MRSACELNLKQIDATHIYFYPNSEQNPKTLIYDVYTKETNYFLGTVKWYANWRQYSFFPEKSTVFEKTCMTEIVDFIKKLTNDRKNSKTTIKD